MRLALRKAGVTRRAAKWHLRKGGATREVARAWIRTSAGLKQFYASLDSGSGAGADAGITVSPASVNGAVIRRDIYIVRSTATTVTVAGGIAPYSYNWVFDTGDTGIDPINPTAPTTIFSAAVDPGATITATFHCAVTDAGGTVANSGPVTVTLSNFGDPV